MRLLTSLCFALSCAVVAHPAAMAHEGHEHGPVVTAEMSDGEIRKVDRDAGKLTIKHGEIKRLDMMPMTMVFRVKDKAMLDGLVVGQKVRFAAEKIEGALTVTAIETVK